MSKKPNWKGFCQVIIDNNGLPSTKVAEEYGISFGYWFELSNRNQSKIVANAREVLARYELMGK